MDAVFQEPKTQVKFNLTTNPWPLYMLIDTSLWKFHLVFLGMTGDIFY